MVVSTRSKSTLNGNPVVCLAITNSTILLGCCDVGCSECSEESSEGDEES